MTRLAAARAWIVDRYLTIDARSVGLGRIGLGVVLLVDLLRRVPVLRLFYSNDGLVPNHTLLWRPPTQWMFSFFFMASLPDEVTVCFVFCGLVYLALLFGWRTRLMRFLALVCVLSLHGRATLVENGGDWMLSELTLWAVFLPLGRRFSVDAVLESLRRRRETTAAELADRAALEPDRAATRIVSLAAFTILFQLAVAYFFNAIQKGGPTWRHGTAVHYVLYQNRMVTRFGVWMRPHMTLALSRVLSYAALATEGSLPILILSPFRRVWTRRAAVLAVIGLHLGFQCFINLGIFSWTMMAYAPFLLTEADWAWLARVAERRGRHRRVTAYFDAGCGVCFQLARVLARVDRFGRVRWVSSAELGAEGADLPSELLARTIVVVDDATGRRGTRSGGLAMILRALPLGALWSLPLRLPGLRGLANLGYDAFARRREAVSWWLGLAACHLPGAPAPVTPVEDLRAPVAPGSPVARPRAPVSPLRALLGRGVAIVREGAVLTMLIVLVTEAMMINQVVPRFLRPEEPLWIKRLVAYPRLIQAWSMFASDAPTSDESVVVEAVTAEGRHVDPYSEVAGRYPHPGTAGIPARLDNDSFFFNYSVRIPDQSAYHQAFLEWILRYPKRTHHPGDRIVKLDAYRIETDSPPPGQTEQRNVRTHIFLSYP